MFLLENNQKKLKILTVKNMFQSEITEFFSEDQKQTTSDAMHFLI